MLYLSNFYNEEAENRTKICEVELGSHCFVCNCLIYHCLKSAYFDIKLKKICIFAWKSAESRNLRKYWQYYLQFLKIGISFIFALSKVHVFSIILADLRVLVILNLTRDKKKTVMLGNMFYFPLLFSFPWKKLPVVKNNPKT